MHLTAVSELNTSISIEYRYISAPGIIHSQFFQLYIIGAFKLQFVALLLRCIS
jgi:hypothetical protein